MTFVCYVVVYNFIISYVVFVIEMFNYFRNVRFLIARQCDMCGST